MQFTVAISAQHLLIALPPFRTVPLLPPFAPMASPSPGAPTVDPSLGQAQVDQTAPAIAGQAPAVNAGDAADSSAQTREAASSAQGRPWDRKSTTATDTMAEWLGTASY